MRRVMLAAVALIAMAAPAAASADTAADYNLFVLGDMKVRSNDTEGRVAVGGNANLNGYTIGVKASSSTTNLVVKGSLDATGGSTNGKVQAGSLVDDTGTDTTWTHGAITTGGTPMVDFAAEGTRLVALSNYLDTYANTGTVDQVCWGSPGSNCYQLTFNATKAGLNVFDIDASILSDTNTITINLGVGSTILVNVSGNVLALDGGMSVNGGNASQVLFNLSQATSFTNGGFGMLGSVLAPNASVVGGGGQLNGQLIVKNFTGDSWHQFAQGNTQINDVKFAGDLLTLTPPGAVPEPAAWALMIGGFGMAGAVLRRKRTMAAA